MGSPGTVSELCPGCHLEAESLLNQVMRGNASLHLVPGALAAWWLAGDNYSETRRDQTRGLEEQNLGWSWPND